MDTYNITLFTLSNENRSICTLYNSLLSLTRHISPYYNVLGCSIRYHHPYHFNNTFITIHIYRLMINMLLI